MKILNILTILALVWVSCASPQTTNFETKVLLNSVTENILGEQINFPDSNTTITSAIEYYLRENQQVFTCTNLFL